MPVTIYSKESGTAITIEHMIDAKDAVASGQYSFNPPAPAKAPEPVEVPKPVSKPDPVKEVKIEPVIEDSPKEEEPPIRKINPRLIRK